MLLLGLVAIALSGFTANGGGGGGPASLPGKCAAGSKGAIIGGKFTCLRAGAKCKAKNQAAYRRNGFTCVSGRLRTLGTPPGGTAPLPFQTGHYKGRTSQNETFDFDVMADGKGVQRLTTGKVNGSCNGGATVWSNGFQYGASIIPISSNGNFADDSRFVGFIDFADDQNVTREPTAEHLVITGHLQGGLASGNLQWTEGFSHAGATFNCDSGVQAWTASRTG